MAKISEQFRSNYIRTEDLDKKGRILTISDVVEEEVGVGRDAKEKLVVYFEEEDKGLPLNKTNAEELAEAFGDDTDGWLGHQCRLYQSTTQFQGKKMSCLRVAPVEVPDATRSTSASGSGSGSSSRSG